IAYAPPELPGQVVVTLVGGPRWVDSEHFDIEAEVEGNPSTEQKRLMLQSLLANRFKLIMHHGTVELPAFALVLNKAGKPGPQLQRHSQDAKCLGGSDKYEGPPPDPAKPAEAVCDRITFWP